MLAVTTAERAPAAPEVPTVAEQGFPKFVAAPWSGFFAPKGTPKAVVDRLSEDLIWALTQADVRQRMADAGSLIVASRPDAFRGFVQAWNIPAGDGLPGDRVGDGWALFDPAQALGNSSAIVPVLDRDFKIVATLTF